VSAVFTISVKRYLWRYTICSSFLLYQPLIEVLLFVSIPNTNQDTWYRTWKVSCSTIIFPQLVIPILRFNCTREIIFKHRVVFCENQKSRTSIGKAYTGLCDSMTFCSSMIFYQSPKAIKVLWRQTVFYNIDISQTLLCNNNNVKDKTIYYYCNQRAQVLICLRTWYCSSPCVKIWSQFMLPKNPYQFYLFCFSLRLYRFVGYFFFFFFPFCIKEEYKTNDSSTNRVADQQYFILKLVLY
jgi:hypothetical protein